MLDVKCARCGETMNGDTRFLTVRRSFRLRPSTVCPACAERDRRRQSRAGPILWMVLTLVSGAAAVWLRQPFFVNAALLCLLLIISVAAHELGHVAAAVLVKLRVILVSLGSGRRIAAFRFRGATLELRLLPFQGIVQAVPCSMQNLRARLLLFIVAGPATTLAILLVAWFAIGKAWPLTSGWYTKLVPWEALFLGNLLLLLEIWPHMTPTVLGMIPNDGLVLLRLLRNPKAEMQSWSVIGTLITVRQFLQDRRLDDAERALVDALQQIPEEPQLLLGLSHVAIMRLQYEKAAEMLVRLLPRPELSGYRAILLNNLAWCNLQFGTEASLEDADRLSREAVQLAPKEPWAKGTRGSVLVKRGRFDEGLPLLQQALAEHTEPDAKAAAAAYLSVAFKYQGQTAAAQAMRQMAQDLDPRQEILARLDAETWPVATGAEPARVATL